MTVAQGSLSVDPLAVPLALLMAVLFVGVAPTVWRMLFPADAQLTAVIGAIRVIAYVAVGAVTIALVGAAARAAQSPGAHFLFNARLVRPRSLERVLWAGRTGSLDARVLGARISALRAIVTSRG